MFILFRFLQEIWIERFSPFWFISCMGTGISATLLRRFPFPAEWLVRCSYIFFAIVCLLFIILQIVSVIQFVQSSWHHHGRKHYYWQTFKNMDNSVFWGTYAMGLQTIINNLFEIAVSEAEVSTANRTRLIYTVYILWWYNVSVSMAIAWGITFIIWKGHYIREIGPNDDSPEIKMMRENLQTMLLLPIVTLVVACSGSGIFIMSDLFTKTFGRNIQLMTLVVTMLLWLHVMAFVAIIFGIYAWNLYVNKLPEANKVFSLFLCLGPMGQGAFGILWLTEDIRKYINLYYPVNRITDLEAYITKISVIWSFKIIGLILALTMLAAGFFFTLLCIMSILSYSKSHPHLFKYQKASLVGHVLSFRDYGDRS